MFVFHYMEQKYQFQLRSHTFVLYILINLWITNNVANGGRILYLNSIPMKSNHYWHTVLAISLAKRGHDVTFVTHFPVTEITPKLNVIVLKGVANTKTKVVGSTGTDLISSLKSVVYMWNWGLEITENCLLKRKFRKLRDFPADYFDLIIYNLSLSFIQPILDHFTAPVIGAASFPYFLHAFDAMGIEWNTSHMPLTPLPFTNKMCLIKRSLNFLLYNVHKYYRRWLLSDAVTRITKPHFGEHRSLTEIENNFTLLLINSDPLLNAPLALPPNVIQVGGMHLKPANKLRGEFKEILEQSFHGAILFSMGSHFKIDQLAQMSPNFLNNTLNAFAKLKQTIIWKSDVELTGISENVIIKRWVPQGDILAHPNLKLFITHGGSLSVQEAMYHGKPCIIIPTFGDQYINAANIADKQIGLNVFIENLNQHTLYQAIQEVLLNPKYRNKMALMSKKYKDRPQTALEKAVYWVEYILKYGPAHDLEIPTRRMNFIQIYNLDIFILFTSILAVILLGIVRCMKYVVNLQTTSRRCKAKTT